MLNLNLLRKELHEQRWVLILGIIIFSAVGIFCAWSFKMFQHYGGNADRHFKPANSR